jgi:uncharacterized protein
VQEMREVIPGAADVRESLSNTALHLILMPTEACNFRCVYCYEEFQYKRMEPHVVQGVKALISRRAPALRRLSLGWFGGEPLLAFDIIEDIASHALLAVRQHSDLSFFSDITTNAFLLTSRRFQRLLDYGVCRFQISFDGPREYHDRKRVLSGGKGTFDRIWANLLATRLDSRRFEVLVRLHADKENQSALQQFLDDFETEFGGDPRYRIFLRPLGRFGGPNDERLQILEGEEAEQVVQSLRNRAAARNLETYAPEYSVCYAARPDSFVIRANGRINKCTMALEHTANQVGHIRGDGSLEIFGDRLMPWARGIFSGRPEELECPMLGLAEPGATGTRSIDIPLTLQSARPEARQSTPQPGRAS